MGLPPVGSVVLIPFPFADFSKIKTRPALVVAHAEFNNLVVCQISSKNLAPKSSVRLGTSDFEKAGLLIDSFIRPNKLSTIEKHLVIKGLGVIKPAKRKEVLQKLRTLFKD